MDFFMGVLCALEEIQRYIYRGLTALTQAASLRQKWRRKMTNNRSKSENSKQHQIPVYLTVHYGVKGGRKLYAHSEEAISKAGGKWLASWKSLGEPIRYRQPRDAA